MAESIWQPESCPPGREYLLGKDLYIKYDNEEEAISQIVEHLRTFVHAEPAVQLNLFTPLSNSERTILAIPFHSDDDAILRNFARMMYQTLIGFYLSAESKTSHFGIANLTLEGNPTSLLRREMEKLLLYIQIRPDIAGRLLHNVSITGKYEVPKPGDVFLSETVRKGMNIQVGYRLLTSGENINCTRIFIPLQTGQEIIEHVYYNLERILHQNFITYDETGDNYLKITETLVFKELEAVLKRAQKKEITRKKILNNLQFNTVFTEESKSGQVLANDKLYDLLNQIQDKKLESIRDQSINLYTTYLSQFKGASESREVTAKFVGTNQKREILGKEKSREVAQSERGKPVAPSPGNFTNTGRLVRRVSSKVPLPKMRGIRVPPKRVKATTGREKAPV